MAKRLKSDYSVVKRRRHHTRTACKHKNKEKPEISKLTSLKRKRKMHQVNPETNTEQMAKRARRYNKSDPSMLTSEPVSCMTSGAEPMYVCMYVKKISWNN